MLNSSVNSYRRLDPHFEAPNQIKASAVDRGSMVRVPIGNERSMRTEVRSVAPDANPYMVMLAVFKTGLEGTTSSAQKPAPSRPLSARQHLRRDGRVSRIRMDRANCWARTSSSATPISNRPAPTVVRAYSEASSKRKKCSTTTKSTTNTCGTCSRASGRGRCESVPAV